MLQRPISSEFEPPNWRRRIATVVVGVGVLVVVYAFLYQWIMGTFEERWVPYLQAVQVVIESLTTAGFGGHAPWESTAANGMIILMNMSGVVLVFLAIPVFLAPLLRNVLQGRMPRSSDQTGHVIVCGYSEKDEVLRQELRHFGVDRGEEIPFLYVEPEEELVRELRQSGVEAIVGDPESVESLRGANASEALALVADVDDETNPSVILAARVIDEELPVVSVVRNHRIAPHHEYAGAAKVIKARESFAQSLAIRVSSSYAKKFRDAIEHDADVDVTELVIEEGCPLIGQTLQEADFGDPEEAVTNVIAAWIGGKFLISPPADTPIRKNSILVVAGRPDEKHLRGIHAIPSCPDEPSRVVIGGYGTVGRTVDAVLESTGIETTVVDTNEGKKRFGGTVGEEVRTPDIIGDITDESTIHEADLSSADAIVLVLNEDIATIYATIVINEVAPDVEIIARADDADSISTLYQAGADFVLSLAEVTGEILASELLDIFGEQGGFLPASTQFEFTRAEGVHFAGWSMLELDLRNRTGCTVVAVERNGDLATNIRGGFVVEEDDTLVIAGSKEAIERFDNNYLPKWVDRHGPAESDEIDEVVEEEQGTEALKDSGASEGDDDAASAASRDVSDTANETDEIEEESESSDKAEEAEALDDVDEPDKQEE